MNGTQSKFLCDLWLLFNFVWIHQEFHIKCWDQIDPTHSSSQTYLQFPIHPTLYLFLFVCFLSYRSNCSAHNFSDVWSSFLWKMIHLGIRSKKTDSFYLSNYQLPTSFWLEVPTSTLHAGIESVLRLHRSFTSWHSCCATRHFPCSHLLWLF